MSNITLAAALPGLPARLWRFSCTLAILACVLCAAPDARAQTRYSVGAHFAGHRMPELGQTRAGYGFRLTYAAYLPFVSVETEVNFFPTTSNGNLSETQAFWGLKFGKNVGRWGAFAKFRPGLTHFGGGLSPQRLNERTKLALDIGGVVEYNLAPKVSLRGDVSNVSIHYGDAMISSGPGDNIGARLGTRNTLQSTFGVILHF